MPEIKYGFIFLEYLKIDRAKSQEFSPSGYILGIRAKTMFTSTSDKKNPRTRDGRTKI